MTPLGNRLKAARWTARVKRWLGDPLTTGLVSVAILATLGLGLHNTREYDRLATCLANYSEQDAIITQQLRVISDEDQRLNETERQLNTQELLAFRDLMAAIRAANGDQKQTAAAWNAYLTVFDANGMKRAELTKQRTKNAEERAKVPVPERPSLACD